MRVVLTRHPRRAVIRYLNRADEPGRVCLALIPPRTGGAFGAFAVVARPPGRRGARAAWIVDSARRSGMGRQALGRLARPGQKIHLAPVPARA
jgi:hypothetical protein